MTDSDLTLQEAAELLGVHYMTAYRYVRLGLLPASKVGGSWHVTSSDLHAFRSGVPATDDSETTGRKRAPWAARLESRLVAGDARGAWGVIEAALSAGAEMEEIYLEVITPAMRSIGARWEAGELDIAVEHRATGIAFRLVGRLGPRFARRGRTRGTVLVGAPEGERHSLPVAMLADLLRGSGWEVSDIGADMPVESFLKAALDTPDLVAVGVSVSAPESLDAAGALLTALAAALPDLPLVVGGRAIHDREHALSLGANGYARSARDFADQLAGGNGFAAHAGA